MDRAKKRINQFKEDFRRGQIDSYFHKIREQLVAERLPELQQKQLNQQVSAMVQQQNVPELYKLLYHDKKKTIQQNENPALLSLSSQTLLQLLSCLIKNMNRLDSILIINNIIDLHYQTVFLNSQNLPLNQLLVKNLYELCHHYIGIMEQSKQHKNMVNASLNCIKSLLFNLLNREKENNSYTFNQVIKLDYTVGYLFSWLEKLIDNPIYLITLTLVEYDIELSATEFVRHYLNTHPNVIVQLLLQADPHNNYSKSCALPSLNLASSFMRNITDKNVLFQVVQPCLATSKTVYGLTEAAGQSFYRINTFLYILTNIADIFKKLEEEALPRSLFEEMETQNYWIFCSNLLRFETNKPREIVFRILLSAVRNAMIANVKLQNYISEIAVGQFVEGLQVNRDQIAISALQIFINLYRYCQQHLEQTKELREWIDMFQIEPGLQMLQYSKNHDISECASRILSMRRQLQKGSVMSEQNL